METKLINIIAVVNDGFSDKVVEIAKDNGAQGGTIIPANGSVSAEASKLYGIGIHPNKEIIIMLVDEKISEKILDRLYTKLGAKSDAKGIYFTLPVSYASDNLINQYKAKKEEN